MATTEHFKDGGGTTFNFSFPILANSDLKVEVYNDTTKVWDLKTENPSGTDNTTYRIVDTNVIFNGTTPSGTGNVHIYRTTNVDSPAAVYAAGSSIRAVDLNDNQTQVLYSTQEAANQLVRETDLKDSIVTSAKIANNTIVNDDISPTAEIAVNKLANGSARQLLQTADNGNDVEWTSNVDIPGTLDVTGLTHFDNHVSLNDNIKINLGSSGSSDSSIYYNGNTLVLDTGGQVVVESTSNQNFKIGSAIRLMLYEHASIDSLDGIYCNWPVVPGTTNTYDLGSDTFEWKDIYIDGVAYVDEIRLDDDQKIKLGSSAGDSEIYYSGTVLNLYANDDIVIDADGDNLDLKSDGSIAFYVGSSIRFQLNNSLSSIIASWPLLPAADDTYDLGSSSLKWKDLYIDGTAYLDTADISSFTGSAVITTGTSTSDTEVYSAKHTEDLFLRQDSTETLASNVAWSSNDTTVATTGAIDARVRGLITDVGGFRPIASEAAFPTTNPDPDDNAGTIVSITALSADRTASGTTLTAGCQTTGGTQVTITGCPNNQVFKQGYGLLVETTSALNTYTFVRYVADTSSVATVANINNNVTTVAGNSSNVTTVAGISSDVTTVAGISSDVTTVANNNSNVTSVAGKATEIGRLGTADAVADMALLGTADAVADMNTLGTSSNVTNMNTLAGISGDVTTVAGISSNVTTVANDGTDIGTVAGISSNVTTVAGISSNVTTVANNNSNVTAVANNSSNINSAVSNASNINSAVSNASNINSAVSNASNINTVAGNNTNINTVAGISGNVTTVAGISGNVTTVAGNNSNVTTVAGSIGNVNTTAGDIANVNTVAGSISNVNTVGSNITNVTNASTYLNNFLSLYLGTAASAPTQDALGNAVTEGDLYFNTGNKQLQIYNGSVFTNIVDTAIDFAKSATAAFNALYTASAGSNSIDLGGLAITGAPFANEALATNRVSLAKGSATYNLGGI